MEFGYNLDIKLNKNTMPSDGSLTPTDVVKSIDLNMCYIYTRLRVFLKESIIDDSSMHVPKYQYELITGPNGDVVASGDVQHCISFESGNDYRAVPMKDLQVITSELLHATIGSIVLANITKLNYLTKENMDFLNAMSTSTPYTNGVSKAGPIVSNRFWMKVPTNIDGLQGKRRFIVDMNKNEIIGMHTHWIYSDTFGTATPKMLFTDVAHIEQQPEDSKFSILPKQHKKVIFIKPMSDREVLVNMCHMGGKLNNKFKPDEI